ncbi:hypothetical protein AAMO2058_001284700 [Amorphochlora amoebiformis]
MNRVGLAQTPVRLSSEPRIYVIDGLFSEDECDLLIEAGRSHITDANVMSGSKATKTNKNKFRDASTTSLFPTVPIVKEFRKRMADLAMLPEENGEPLQLTRYKEGQKYGLHFDSSTSVGRLATVLVFLNSVEDGGELVFPWATRDVDSSHVDGVSGFGRDIQELKNVKIEPPISLVCRKDKNSLKISPHPGRAVVFFTHAPDLKRESYRAMHGGCPIRKGEKWISQLFIDWNPVGTTNTFERLVKTAGLDNWNRPVVP